MKGREEQAGPLATLRSKSRKPGRYPGKEKTPRKEGCSDQTKICQNSDKSTKWARRETKDSRNKYSLSIRCKWETAAAARTSSSCSQGSNE